MAAQDYAHAGWFVLPVLPGKHAGSYVGNGWPDKSSRDPETIARWFDRDYSRKLGLGIALHVGRSGAIAFDADDPEHLPPLLRWAIAVYRPVFQATRGWCCPPFDPYRKPYGRGHYLFALPDGVVFGNGLGSLRSDPAWGEVRGRNGIILAEPTPHAKAADGGVYQWWYPGLVPELPRRLGQALLASPGPVPDARPSHPIYDRSRVRGLLDALMRVEDGQQNSTLFWVACRFGEMVGHGRISDEMASDLLIDAGMMLPAYRPEDPWTVSAVSATVASGIRTGSWAVRG